MSVAVRAELDRAIEFVREGDALIVTKLDRLARSTAHLLTISAELEGKRVALRVLDLNLDTTTATGRLLFTMIGAIAAFEREMMLERQREGQRGGDGVEHFEFDLVHSGTSNDRGR